MYRNAEKPTSTQSVFIFDLEQDKRVAQVLPALAILDTMNSTVMSEPTSEQPLVTPTTVKIEGANETGISPRFAQMLKDAQVTQTIETGKIVVSDDIPEEEEDPETWEKRSSELLARITPVQERTVSDIPGQEKHNEVLLANQTQRIAKLSPEERARVEEKKHTDRENEERARRVANECEALENTAHTLYKLPRSLRNLASYGELNNLVLTGLDSREYQMVFDNLFFQYYFSERDKRRADSLATLKTFVKQLYHLQVQDPRSFARIYIQMVDITEAYAEHYQLPLSSEPKKQGI